MWRRRGAAITVIRWLVPATVIVALIGGCGGGASGTANGGRPHGLVDVRKVTYSSSFDGSQVKGLAAIPRAVPSRGCLIWESGFRSRKEDAALVWQGFAALGLSTFSIDLRYHGERASNPTAWDEVRRTPSKFAALIKGTVGDLRSAVDHLHKQRYCAGNIVYAGASLGGAIGTILAAAEKRVKAVVLLVTPGTWRQVIATPGTPLLPGVARDPARLEAALRTLSPLDPARFVGRISPRPVLILSGLRDKTVVMSNARALQAAARRPKTIIDFRGGHNPALGPDADANAHAVASFLLHTVVEPTYGIKSNPNGTFLLQQ